MTETFFHIHIMLTVLLATSGTWSLFHKNMLKYRGLHELFVHAAVTELNLLPLFSISSEVLNCYYLSACTCKRRNRKKRSTWIMLWMNKKKNPNYFNHKKYIVKPHCRMTTKKQISVLWFFNFFFTSVSTNISLLRWWLW